MRGRLAPSLISDLRELSDSRSMREALQWFTREKQWINEQHLEVCRIPAPTFLEHERAIWVAAALRASGWHASIDRAGNVCALQDPDTELPLVAVTAHLDTVLAPKSRDEVMIDREGRFRGPGVSDNGAGLAALLALGRALKLRPLRDGIQAEPLLVANVGEEGEGNLSGMRFLCRQSPLAPRIASFLVLDGATTDHITCEALGSKRYEVTIQGPGGHSWSDFGTANPVHAMGRAIAYFSETPLNGGPRASFNVGLVEGGSSINAIPALARAKVDIRSESNERIEEIAQFLTISVDRALESENARASAGRVTSRVKEIGSRPAGKLDAASPLLAYLKAVDAHLGIRSHVDCASTDANIPLSLGIPAVSIGAGGQGGGAHTQLEWFSPDGRDLGLKRILLALCLLLREPDGGRSA